LEASQAAEVSLPMSIFLGGNLGGILVQILANWVGFLQAVKNRVFAQVDNIEYNSGLYWIALDYLCATG
jgi:hypothetical protein